VDIPFEMLTEHPIGMNSPPHHWNEEKHTLKKMARKVFTKKHTLQNNLTD
jgi:hypothetical protein